jgi:hypothetical protein
MNRNWQLTDKYCIPAYAQDMLCLVPDGGEVRRVRGQHGTLDVAPTFSGPLRLAWESAAGPILAVWDRLPDNLRLDWDGRVKVGGFVERLHAREIGGQDVVIAEVVGGPLPADHVGLPSLDDMRRGVYARTADVEPLYSDQVYPFVVLAENNLASLVQDALVSGLAVDAYGSLASEEPNWRGLHEVVGLPLLLDMLTLHAP